MHKGYAFVRSQSYVDVRRYPKFVVGTETRLWLRRPNESKEAYAAFEIYFKIPLGERSIDKAWYAAKQQQKDNGKRAPRHWMGWSSQHDWPVRALAFDDYLAEKDLAKWEGRRAEMRERDWTQADKFRRIVDEALPYAEKFFRSSTKTIRGTPTVVDANGVVLRQGRADRQIITTAFAVVELLKVMLDASKLQRLTTDQPTAHIQLSGAALDAAIEHELAKLADLRSDSTQ